MAKLLQLPAQSVYSKALTLFVAFSFLLGMSVVLLTSEIILREFQETERQEMIATLQRFTLMLSRETRPMEISLAEWGRGKLTPSSLPDSDSLSAMQVDFVSLASPDGQIRDTSFRTSAVQEIYQASTPWTKWIPSSEEMALPQSGFLLMDGRLAAIVCHTVPDGSLSAEGRIFDAEALSFFEGMFGARIDFEPLRSVNVSDDRSQPLLSMLARNEFVVKVEGPNELTGRILIRGINGMPIGQIKISQTRPLYAEGVHAVQVFLTILTLAGGTLFLVMWILLDRTILARIRELTEKVERDKELLPLRLDFAGNDELATLARKIENLAHQLDRARWSYRAVVEDQNEVICRFSPGFELTFANGIFQRTFPQSPQTGGFLQRCLPTDTFNFLAKKFSALTPENPLETFVHQILANEGSAQWFRSTLRANFLTDSSCAGGQWVAADITPEVQAQQKLQSSEMQLRTLSNRLMRLQDDERRKIARELHDSTAQSLSALEMNMSLLEPLAGDEYLQRIVAETRQIARDCCMELRSISYLLHPPLLDEVGLPFALQWFTDGFMKRTPLQISLEIMPSFSRLPAEDETTLFRIVQEAMSNIHRHSGASKAWISLEQTPREVRLEIRDNGTGFSTEKDTQPDSLSGVGLAGMRERLAQLGGELTIRSSPYGVGITATIPFHAPQNEKNPHC